MIQLREIREKIILLRILRKWLRNEEGAAAIEFALLAIPFFYLVFAIIEASLMFTSASLLEGATSSAARLVRTGQIQQAGGDQEAAFRDALCDYATVLIDCNNVVIEAIPLSSFNDYDDAQPEYDEDGNLVSQGFDAAGSNDRVLLRTSVRYNMLSPFVGQLLAGNDNRLLFMSTIVLQTEPYEFEVE